MKKSVAWAVSWTLYGIGHVVSRPMYRWDAFAWLYPLYNGAMHLSTRAQDWGEANGPWGPITSDPMGD